MAVIEAEGLHKRLGDFPALRGLDLRVGEGEFLGIAGPNGSGKSTLLRTLVGILVPTEGEVRVLGKDPARDKSFLEEVGVVFGNKSGLWPFVPVRDSLKYFAGLYKVPSPRERIEEVACNMDATRLLDRLPKNLSLGQRIKCELMAALLHDPQLLVLDEPTLGLDIAVKEDFLSYLARLNELGKTILLVSHAMGDMDRTDRLMVMGRGEFVFEGTPAELRARVNYKKLTLHLSQPLGGRYVVQMKLKEGMGVDDALRIFRSKGVKDFEVRMPSVEDVLAELYRGMG